MDFPGIDGFLGTRASITLDLVFTAMFAVVPVMAWSIWLVKRRRRWELHKRMQLGLLAALGVAIVLFEIDMRFVSGWRERAMPSPYYESVESAGPVWSWLCLTLCGMERVPGWVYRGLVIHLVFAVSTTVLWVWTAWGALRHFPKPPAPNEYSASHRFWGWLAAADMVTTALTGWTFYWLAFVA
jgi:putative membrane protein